MKPSRLRKYFPELAHLPSIEQDELIASAQVLLLKNKQVLRDSFENILRAMILLALCLIAIKYVGPALRLSHQATALVIMCVVIPAYFFVQHKQYIKKLRVQIKILRP